MHWPKRTKLKRTEGRRAAVSLGGLLAGLSASFNKYSILDAEQQSTKGRRAGKGRVMAIEFKYPLSKQFQSWARRSKEERLAVLRELWDENPLVLRRLREEIEETANEPTGGQR